ncbi:hypothetical protein NDU88_006866 [Pleurodeles waltl]|uniref:Uncharacterized protein n=1 Tax=Pleurodeles waltl TaxID=8319 RepID=A0AAV7TYU2_PLEWA|nr:hypothetical protein NDU88_006866 [Pleurodeles waltl]
MRDCLMPDFWAAWLPVGAPPAKPGPRVPERRHPRHTAPGDRSRDRITEGQGCGDLPVPLHPSVGDTKRSPRNPQIAASEEQNHTSYLLPEVPFFPGLFR